MRILLLGKDGQVGWELQRALAPLGEVIALGRLEADFSRPEDLRAVVRDVSAQMIFNAAAYTDVDRAEIEPELAMTVNGAAPGVLAEEARRLRAVLIHYSTDYVFDGTKEDPYTESDAPNPINVYGRSKLAGEDAIRSVGGSCLILRTSWVYSLRRDSFVTKVLRWAQEHETLRIVDDQVGSPTWARTLADVTRQVAAKSWGEAYTSMQPLRGTYHVAGAGHCSRYQWACAILQLKLRHREDAIQRLEPSTTAEFPSLAARPRFSALHCSKVEQTFGVKLPPWKDILARALAEDRR